jgi:Na+-translocating ferredoxin:NAD+ oxidoreductase subunit G
MRDIIKTTIPLFVICIVTGICLSYVNSITKAPIAQRINEASELKKAEVLKEAQSFTELKIPENISGKSKIITAAFKGVSSGKTVGFVFNVSPKGYGGPIDVTVGIGVDGSVTGVKLGENKETPGLGTKVAEAPFITQYDGKNIKTVFELVKKPPAGNQIQAISGATISSRAVNSAVQAAADCAKELIEAEAVNK